MERHFQVMKHNAILCNSGHFDCEVDVAALGRLAEERFPRRQNIEGFRLPDGRILNVLAEGRLVNLAAGNGHPAEIMDMSFAVQVLSLEWMAKHAPALEKKVYNVPAEIDDQIGRVKLAAHGAGHRRPHPGAGGLPHRLGLSYFSERKVTKKNFVQNCVSLKTPDLFISPVDRPEKSDII